MAHFLEQLRQYMDLVLGPPPPSPKKSNFFWNKGDSKAWFPQQQVGRYKADYTTMWYSVNVSTMQNNNNSGRLGHRHQLIMAPFVLSSSFVRSFPLKNCFFFRRSKSRNLIHIDCRRRLVVDIVANYEDGQPAV